MTYVLVRNCVCIVVRRAALYAVIRGGVNELAVLVENGGFGAQAAAPVARQLIDYWLTGANSLELPPPKGVPLITQRRNR